MKFSIKDFFSECDQIRSFPRIWSHLLKKSLMESFIFCAVNVLQYLKFFNLLTSTINKNFIHKNVFKALFSTEKIDACSSL